MNWIMKLITSEKSTENAEAYNTQYTTAEYCERGEKSLGQGKYVEAMEFFQAAIETDSHFEKAYLLLATAYERQGKIDKAKATLYGLLAIDPNNAEAKRRVQGENEKQNVVHVKPDSIIKSDNSKRDGKNIGEITFSIVKVLFCVLFALELVWTVIAEIFYDVVDGDFRDGFLVFIVVNYFMGFILYKFIYLLLYRRDNFEGDKFGEGKYNPIVYKPVRNNIFIVFLFVGIIALVYSMCFMLIA